MLLAAITAEQSRLLIFVALAVVGLIVLVARFKLNAFLALILASLFVGLCSGMPLPLIAKAFQEGVGNTLGFIAVVVGLGTMLGKMLAESGGAEVVASTFVRKLGTQRLHWAMLAVAFVVGLPVFFGVGLVLLIPILFTLVRETRKPLLFLGIPMVAGLSVSHGLIPPHPGPMVAIEKLGADVGKTILYAMLIGIPTAVIAGPIFARFIVPRSPGGVGRHQRTAGGVAAEWSPAWLRTHVVHHRPAGVADAGGDSCRGDAGENKSVARLGGICRFAIGCPARRGAVRVLFVRLRVWHRSRSNPEVY